MKGFFRRAVPDPETSLLPMTALCWPSAYHTLIWVQRYSRLLGAAAGACRSDGGSLALRGKVAAGWVLYYNLQGAALD